MKESDNESETFVEYDEEGDRVINPGTLTEEEELHFEKAKK